MSQGPAVVATAGTGLTGMETVWSFSGLLLSHPEALWGLILVYPEHPCNYRLPWHLPAFGTHGCLAPPPCQS